MPDSPTKQADSVLETKTEKLFEPCQLGPYTLPHRIVMAPLTRSRAGQPGNVPSPLMAC